MRRPLNDSEVFGAALGAIVAIAVAGLLGSIRGEVSQANASLILVLVIVGAAATGGRWAGGATALASALAFDFFLVRPYGSLAIKSTDDVVTTVLLFVVGVTVGQFANARWRDRAASDAGAEEVAGLHRVATLVAGGAPLLDVVEHVEREVAQVLRLQSCHFTSVPPASTLPELEASGRVEAPYVHRGDGFVLPADGLAIVVRNDGETLGWLVCTPRQPAEGVSLDRRRTALVLAEHLGLVAAQANANLA